MSRLSVIVVHWNRDEVTRACLRALAGWRRLRPRILVVDNGSTLGDPEGLEREFPAVEWLTSDVNRGFGGANNLALERADTEFVLLLNNDAAIAEDDVERLLAAMDRHPRLFALGPVLAEGGPAPVRLAGGRDIARHVGTRWKLDELPTAQRIDDEVVGVDYVPGAAALLRTAIVRRLGGLEEGYFFGGELADLCKKARRAGHQVGVQLSAAASHDSAAAADLRDRLYPYYALRNRFLYLRRHERRARLLLEPAWSLYGVAAVARAVLQRRPVLARALGLAVVDGLRGRFGDQNRRVLGTPGGGR